MQISIILAIAFFLIGCQSNNIEESIIKKEFELPKGANSQPVVSAVFPTSDSLPENLLRLYVQFSQPMKTVGNLENIKLVNEEREEVTGAIFNNVYELWDSKQKQLTIILDPARIKSDLKVNQKMGRALKPDKQFQLIIEHAEDIYGQPLKAPYIKSFYVLQEDKETPDINNWSIAVPESGSTSPLTIQFPQALDQMSLWHRIRIIDSDGKLVDGKIAIGPRELSWHFTPFPKWKKGRYIVQVNSRLEDPAGNNLNGLFDHKIGDLKNKQEEQILKIEVDVR